MSTRNAEKLRRLVATRLGVPWRSVRVTVRTDTHRKRRQRAPHSCLWAVYVVACGGRAVDTGAFGHRRRWVVARAVLYAQARATTHEEMDAIDAAHPPLHGRIGRGP